jgi:hypothetical protein
VIRCCVTALLIDGGWHPDWFTCRGKDVLRVLMVLVLSPNI